MPSTLHELLLEILRSRPRLLLDLLGGTHEVHLPEGGTVRAGGEAVSAAVVEYRPDCVLEVRDAADVLVRVLVVEVQLRHDPAKAWAWPAHQALVRARHRVPCDVVVVTPSAHVAERARGRFDLGSEGGSTFRPVVVGPEVLGQRPSVASARGATPERWFLYALVTVPDDPTVVLEADAALAGVPEPVAALYLDELLSKIAPAMRGRVEQAMDLENYEFRSDFFKKRIARWQEEARATGLAEGRATGLAEGRATGLAEGRATGLAEGRAEARAAVAGQLLALLASRGLVPSADERERIEACDDVAHLARWLARAAGAATVGDVLAG